MLFTSALLVLLGLGALALLFLTMHAVARFEEPVRRSTTSALDFVGAPIRVLHEVFSSATTWLWERAHRAFTQAEPLQDGEWEGWPVIGAFFYAAMVAANLYAELWLLVMTLPLLGFSFAVSAPYDAGWLTAAAALSLGLFWGGMASEAIGLTNMTPWRRRSRRDHIWLGIASGAAILGLLVTLGSLGYYRGLVMTLQPGDLSALDVLDPFAAGEGLDLLADPTAHATTAGLEDAAAIEAQIAHLERTLPPFVGTMLLLLAGMTFVAGKWSLGHALAYLSGALFAALWLVISPIHVALRIAFEMFETLRGPLVADVTNLSHLSARALFDWYASHRDEAFHQEAADIRGAAHEHRDDLSAELLRRAAQANGAQETTTT